MCATLCTHFSCIATPKMGTMNTNVKRLRKELQELKKNPEEDMVLYPEEDTIMRWKAFIRGPKDTPFEDGVFELAILTTPLYPMEPPKMKFLTKIFHPNVHFKVNSMCICRDLISCCEYEMLNWTVHCAGWKHLPGYSQEGVVPCVDVAGTLTHTKANTL